MNREFEKWLETVRRRPLSPAEQSQLDQFLAQHPDHLEDWIQEMALTQLLLDLPVPPVSPGFTERVVACLPAEPLRPQPLGWPFRLPQLPRPALGFALAGLLVLLGGAGFLVHQQRAQSRLAASVADLSRQIELAADATELPPVQFLQDFDAIYHLSQSLPLADDELLAALE